LGIVEAGALMRAEDYDVVEFRVGDELSLTQVSGRFKYIAHASSPTKITLSSLEIPGLVTNVTLAAPLRATDTIQVKVRRHIWASGRQE
jgi:hypothetical protein